MQNHEIGWHFSRNMDTEFVLITLNNAVKAQNGLTSELILHSGRGSQYTSHIYQDTVKSLHIRQSFSAKGCPYDNAPIESFHAILKKELALFAFLKDICVLLNAKAFSELPGITGGVLNTIKQQPRSI